ncbi:MAG TPA: phage tail protein I [Ktedonobacteraceae bacterium]|nr:phage tail protein I [Ktedonobacteraceae bacterium]
MARQTPQLIIQMQGEIIKTIELNTPVLQIGRTPESALQLDHSMISRNHAEIRLGPLGAVLTDLGSTNGTFIGEERLLPNQPHLLTDGATFRLGPYYLTYRTSAAEPRESDEPPPQQELPSLPVEVAVTRKPATPPQAAQQVHKAPDGSMASLYARFLPDIYQENDFFQRFLHIFEDIWEPLEQRQDHIPMYFDPHTCPVIFLPWLASWLDIPLNPRWPEARQRRLLAQAMELYSWRGTSYGLARLIEICTGLTPVITEKPKEPFVFHIRISLAPNPNGEVVDRAFIEELIQMHKPAHAGYILEILP